VYATTTADTDDSMANIVQFMSISKIEILIGSQVWQTLTGFSMYSNHVLSNQSFILEYMTTTNINTGNGTASGATPINYIIPLSGAFVNTVSPINSNFSDQVNNGYLMAAASNQDMHVKVYWGNGVGFYYGGKNGDLFKVDVKSCKMFCKQTTLSNFEREKIRSMVLPKRVIMTQSISQPVTLKPNDNNYNFNINCDSFNIFTSALAIDLSIFQLINNSDNPLGINTVELFLNGSSFSGPLTVEFLGSCSALSSLNIFKSPQSIVIFPLSNNLYGSGVPLNRFDSIRLVIKLVAINWGLNSNTLDTLNVTALGQSTILYSGGAASLNKY